MVGGNSIETLIEMEEMNMNTNEALEAKLQAKEEKAMAAKDEFNKILTGEASRCLEQKKQKQAEINNDSVNIEEVAPVQVPDEIEKPDNSAEEQLVCDDELRIKNMELVYVESSEDRMEDSTEEEEQSVHDEIVLDDEAKDSSLEDATLIEAGEGEEEQSTEENTVESIEEGKLNSDKILPEIKSEDKRVTLCIRDGYRLEMMPVYNADNMIVEKCKLFLVNSNTNIPMIGAGTEMQIAKEKIMSAHDHTVFNVVKKFIINFSDDDIKKAFDRAKEFLETSRSMLAFNNSLNIIDAYREVVRRAIEMSKSEDNATDSKTTEGRRCKYNPEEKMVSIRDKYMKEILEDTGYTPVTFCKKICMTEACMGVEILKHHRGRYTYNEAGNQRFYKLWVIDEIMTETEVA